MKSSLILLFLYYAQLSSVDVNLKNKRMNQGKFKESKNVLPPKTEQPQQPIQKQENIDPKVATEIIAVIKENIAATQAEDKERVIKYNS